MQRKPLTPTTNVHLKQKWDMINYEIHRFNVKHIKSKIDSSAPITYMHMFVKPKKLQMEMERASAIQRENVMLMDRLATIERKGGWVDSKNYHEIKSLNTHKRQKEMIELCHSNRTMLERIKETHSNYNKNKLEDQYEFYKKTKALMAKQPANWREIKQKMKKQREEIRQKYVYPRAGVQNKSKKNVIGNFSSVTDGRRNEDKKSVKSEISGSSKTSKTDLSEEMNNSEKRISRDDGKEKNEGNQFNKMPPEKSEEKKADQKSERV